MNHKDHLAKLLAVKGVEAAALVSTAGELLAGEAKDPAAIERLVSLQTAALAAGQALGELIPPAAATPSAADAVEEAPGGRAEAPQAASDKGLLMVIYTEGPVLFAPLPDGESVCVVALTSPQDVGRARFALRGLLPALTAAAGPVA